MSEVQNENVVATTTSSTPNDSSDEDLSRYEAVRDREHSRTCSSSFVHLHRGDGSKCACEPDMTDMLSKLDKAFKKENGWLPDSTDCGMADISENNSVNCSVDSKSDITSMESMDISSYLVPTRAKNEDGTLGDMILPEILRPKRRFKGKTTVAERLTDPTLDDETRLRLTKLQLRNVRKSARKKESVNCPICEKSIKRNSMSRHLKTHNRVKKYKCKMCGEQYDRVDYFEKHKALHADERPYKCGICGKGFKEERKMRKHLLTHTGEKPYICSICDKAFTDSSALYKHLRAHKGEKPYVCSFCGKAFNESTKVVRHMRIHTGEKPFECPICSRAFNDKSSRSKHIRTHKEAVETDNRLSFSFDQRGEIKFSDKRVVEDSSQFQVDDRLGRNLFGRDVPFLKDEVLESNDVVDEGEGDEGGECKEEGGECKEEGGECKEEGGECKEEGGECKEEGGECKEEGGECKEEGGECKEEDGECKEEGGECKEEEAGDEQRDEGQSGEGGECKEEEAGDEQRDKGQSDEGGECKEEEAGDEQRDKGQSDEGDGRNQLIQDSF